MPSASGVDPMCEPLADFFPRFFRAHHMNLSTPAFARCWPVLGAALVLAGCASTAPRPDECLREPWLQNASDLPAFWHQVRGWTREQFEQQCTASAATPGLSEAQRLKLSMAYSAPGNPRRNLAEALALLPNVPDENSDLVSHLTRVQTSVTQEVGRIDQLVIVKDNQIEEMRTRLNAERERVEAERRRALAAEERSREADRRLVDASAKLADANRRLDALRSVDEQMRRRARSRKTTP
jgi:hypothetical protein